VTDSLNGQIRTWGKLQPFKWKHEWVHVTLVFCILLTVYLFCAPRTISLEDSGDFILSSLVNGIAHPPGYPLFTMMGSLFSSLPLGTIAFRIHAMSALFAALTCVMVFWIAMQLIHIRSYAYLASLGFGLSRIFWSQAIIAEVYSLNTLFFFSILGMCLSFQLSGKRLHLFFIAFLFGLSLSNHLPLMMLSSPCYFFLLWDRRKDVQHILPSLVLLFLLGLSPYIYMIIRSQYDPLISFYGPIESLQQFLYIVHRKGYSHLDNSPSAGVLDSLLFMVFLSREMWQQFGAAGAILTGIGFVRQWKLWPKNISIAFFLAFLGSSLMLVLLLQFDYEYWNRAIFKVYPLIPYGILSLWLGLGARELFHCVFQRTVVLKLLLPVMIVSILGFIAKQNYDVNQRSDYLWARDYGQVILETLEENAIFITYADSDIGPLAYLHMVDGVRPDVALYNEKGIFFKNRLFRPPASPAKRQQGIVDFIRKQSRPIYFMSMQDISLPYGLVDYGLYKKIDKSTPAGVVEFKVNPELMAYCESILEQDKHNDMWTVMHRKSLLSQFARLLSHRVYLGGDATYKPLLDKLAEEYEAKLMILNTVLKKHPDTEKLWQWIYFENGTVPVLIIKLKQ